MVHRNTGGTHSITVTQGSDFIAFRAVESVQRSGIAFGVRVDPNHNSLVLPSNCWSSVFELHILRHQVLNSYQPLLSVTNSCSIFVLSIVNLKVNIT